MRLLVLPRLRCFFFAVDAIMKKCNNDWKKNLNADNFSNALKIIVYIRKR